MNNSKNPWETVYREGRQLNSYPYTDVVAFCFRNWGSGAGRGKTALDVGCGSGVHSKLLSDFGAKVLSIDFSKAAIEHASEAFGTENTEFQVIAYDAFEPGERKFDMVIDRCSTTHSTPDITRDFYQNLKRYLNRGAKLFWQGFSWENSARAYGAEQENGSWSEFDRGIFAELGQTAFFKREDLESIFFGYEMETVRHISDQDMNTLEKHTSWIVELKYD